MYKCKGFFKKNQFLYDVETETYIQYNIVNTPMGGRIGHEKRRAGHSWFLGLI